MLDGRTLTGAWIKHDMRQGGYVLGGCHTCMEI